MPPTAGQARVAAPRTGGAGEGLGLGLGVAVGGARVGVGDAGRRVGCGVSVGSGGASVGDGGTGDGLVVGVALAVGVWVAVGTVDAVGEVDGTGEGMGVGEGSGVGEGWLVGVASGPDGSGSDSASVSVGPPSGSAGGPSSPGSSSRGTRTSPPPASSTMAAETATGPPKRATPQTGKSNARRVIVQPTAAIPSTVPTTGKRSRSRGRAKASLACRAGRFTGRRHLLLRDCQPLGYAAGRGPRQDARPAFRRLLAVCDRAVRRTGSRILPQNALRNTG